MGDLSHGDRRMLATMRSKLSRGTPAGHRFPLPPGASFCDGSVHKVLREGGYVGAFRVSTDDDGGRYAVLLDFDKPDSWQRDAGQ